MSNPRLIAGAMSGTSADGVDIAIVEVTGRGLAMAARPLAHAYEPFAPELRTQILDVRQRGDVRLSDLAEIGRQVTLAHARAFRLAIGKANVAADQIAAIAAHGQTLFHGPPNTIQYLDPSLLAWETGCAVVSDFRRADLAAGGQGAPLVPFADWILFRHPTRSRVILNIGGIANLTYLNAGGSIDEVIAFDTGPGMCISDHLAREAKLADGFDEDGMAAYHGVVRETLLEKVDLASFENLAPPKSTDGPAMIRPFLDARDRNPMLWWSSADLMATAAALTARMVAKAIERWVGGVARTSADVSTKVSEVFVAGGGARNVAFMRELGHELRFAGNGGCEVESLETLLTVNGSEDPINLAAAREAIAFALLAAATLDSEPSNVPSATGAGRRVVLGSITPRP